MIARIDSLAAVPTPREGADIDICLGIDGYAKDAFEFIGNSIGTMDICKDGVCFSYFFWACIWLLFSDENPIG